MTEEMRWRQITGSREEEEEEEERALEWEGWVDECRGDKNVSFCFSKHDERQEQLQQNNLPDKNHSNSNKGEERRKPKGESDSERGQEESEEQRVKVIHERSGTLMYRMEVNHRRLWWADARLFFHLKKEKTSQREHCTETRGPTSLYCVRTFKCVRRSLQ